MELIFLYVYNVTIAAGTCYLIVEHNWSMWTWLLAFLMMMTKVDTKKND
jgi:hypothetical protein